MRTASEEMSKELLEEVLDNGFICSGRESAKKACQEFLSFKKVSKLLEGSSSMAFFQEKMDEVIVCHESNPIPGIEQEKSLVLAALNLYCPNAKCHRMLSLALEDDGCNAAICKCRTHFCYLCLKISKNRKKNHKHARSHATNLWERRDALTGLVPKEDEAYSEYILGKPYNYGERYWWLIIRGQLEDALLMVQEGLREEVLISLTDVLKSIKMWPISFNKSFCEWMSQIIESDLDDLNRIALLQNEHIFQIRRKIPKNSSDRSRLLREKAERILAIKMALKELGAFALTTLDVGEEATKAQAMALERRKRNAQKLTVKRAIPLLGVRTETMAEEELAQVESRMVTELEQVKDASEQTAVAAQITSIDHEEPPLLEEGSSGADHLDLGSFKMSLEPMTKSLAVIFCQSLNSRLANINEYSALSGVAIDADEQSLGPQGKLFWLLESLDHPTLDYAFYRSKGYVGSSIANKAWAICSAK